MFVSRGVAAGAVAMLPNVLPVLLIFGGMGGLGFPVDIGGVIEKVDDPAYATALGTLVWGMREDEQGFRVGTVQMKRALQNVGGWFKSLLP